MKAIRRMNVRTSLPERLSALGELMTNLRWSWHPPTRALFASVDPTAWEEVRHDPSALLAEVSAERLAALADDEDFLRRLAETHRDLREYVSGARWFQSLSDAPRAIGYFSPEFGLTEVLPQYSGGLGILAGDHLKAASDLGVPIIGLGLLYRHGYFRQSLSHEGWQQERYPAVDPDGLPLTLVRTGDGAPVQIAVELPGGRTLLAQIWQAHVGRVPLLLLDSDIEGNAPAEREVTDRLYGGSTEHRLLQEMLLGIGGVRAIRAWCAVTGHPAPEVFHTNEGHAGFLGLERIRELVADRGLAFDEALEAVRAGTVFTTHTPVPAGIDRFPRDLVESHFGADNGCEGMPVEQILELGAETYTGGDPDVFNMAVMGLRLGQRANGVSLLHGEVSRTMFGGLWPGFDVHEVPITSVTNGVHERTWAADDVLALLHPDGLDSQREFQPEAWRPVVDAIDDATIWRLRATLRERLVHEARRRIRLSAIQRGASEAELSWVDDALDPEVLTVGFARRVPSYKRLTLMLREPERLRELLFHPERPIQIVIAGKAHPADDGGKKLIQEIVRFADDAQMRHRIVFLPDYDMELARFLVAGCDVWLNNPLRPLEACGTSGMKSALNGGLNLSIRDGWWDEWFDGENGWPIPSADTHPDPERRDDLEAGALYDLIDEQVAPRFYDRDEQGLPGRWIEMVRHTLAELSPRASANRMLVEYVTRLYAPAALSSAHVAADDFAGARRLAKWKGRVRKAWPSVLVEHVESTGAVDVTELGGAVPIRSIVSLGELEPGDVDVQVVYGRLGESDEIVSPSTVSLAAAGRLDDGRLRYEGRVPLDRTGAFGYTVRVLPHHELLADATELGLVVLPDAPAGMTNGTFR
ncbi:MAG: alpha-glucan family phosphorylase [Streptosporangiales bacterium]|nr:alpha-glucan family phosphorylase [Streptosporangiales bacterium]